MIVQAIDILKTTELYEPSLREDTDPVTTEFVEALLSVMFKIFNILYTFFPRRLIRRAILSTINLYF